MELYARVRRAVFVEGVSEREAAQRFGLARYLGSPGRQRRRGRGRRYV